MAFLDKLNKAISKAKTILAKQPSKVVESDGSHIGKNIKYSEDDILNAGITRDFKNKKEQRDITAIREERKMKARIEKRVSNHKKSL
ncbi:hypothetical protein D0N36_07780 [Hymenobacter lapidiphilus]|uniref:hypothetical protein n=1 Tax=Hymenobacter sp. CCM 8763 TaxID=2303334 RepID=UPI000E348973|nr:hypothetical protein [Hymenobacter sp. CCM 8763]RFP65588.1 hypothetical protein D0N36_07780 [Hymenobacter sp. CCM 8763]